GRQNTQWRLGIGVQGGVLYAGGSRAVASFDDEHAYKTYHRGVPDGTRVEWHNGAYSVVPTWFGFGGGVLKTPFVTQRTVYLPMGLMVAILAAWPLVVWRRRFGDGRLGAGGIGTSVEAM